MLKLKYQASWIVLTSVVLMLVLVTTHSVMAASDEGQGDGIIALSEGRSELVSAPWSIAKVSVAAPKIADVQIAAPDQVVVLAKSIGSTDLILWSDSGQTITKVITVHVDVSELQNDLSRLFPDARLVVGKSRDLVTVRGLFNRAEDARRLRSYMETVGLKHLDMTSVAGVQQVHIKVRVAEASRTALRSLGVNAVHTGNDFFGASTIGGNSNSLDIGVPAGSPAVFGLPFTFNSATSVGSAVTLFAGIPDLDLQLFLQALEDNQYMRVLAEPSLVAVSGEEASFLAGGEFPIPVVQGSGGGDGNTSITIEFKEFGIRLKFRPTVLGDGTIRLKLAPEVSQLSNIGSVQIEGFSIPSLITRRAETTLEMHSGQTFALAGLLNQTTSAQAQNTPGFGNVPVLGSLFRSVRYQQEDTELIVLATVSLVEPLSITGVRPLPGDLHDAPSDWELYVNGWIEGRVPAKRGDVHATWLREHGLDQLKGPGAWESYMGASGPSPWMNGVSEEEESEAPADQEASELDAMPEDGAAADEVEEPTVDAPADEPEQMQAPEETK